MTTPSLAPEQQLAYDAVADGRSVFITGNGGTGKSFLLDRIREDFPTAVTASTGIAALNVGGATIHSFTGLGIGQHPVDKIIANMLRNETQYNDRKYQNLLGLKRLAIDELPMLEARYFELVDELFRKIKCVDAPFGGMQVILLGDFLQLPPINRNGIPKFAFESRVWQELQPEVHMLRKTFRQADQEFADILNDIRIGKLSAEGVALLNERFTAIDTEPHKPGIILDTNNDGCDHKNSIEVKKLLEKAESQKTYRAQDSGVSPQFIDQLDKNCLAPSTITLCPGARVMLLKNLDVYGGLANGSLGTVTKVYDKEVHVRFDNERESAIAPADWEFTNGEEVLARRSQIPLRLAWAVTVHKSQGMSLPKLEAHLDKCFAQGQAYVALSRAKNREGLFLRGGKSIKISANPRAVKFYQDNV